MNPSKSERCVQLFKTLQIFGFDQQFRSEPNDDGTVPLLSAKNAKTIEGRQNIIDGRQILMKHILDCISSLRYIHNEYNSFLQNFPVYTTVDILAAKDHIFLKAVSLSLEGIFDPSDRDERVDLLLNAFPGDDHNFLPLHWAMLAGAGVDDKTVGTIYNDDPLALQQSHQPPSEEDPYNNNIHDDYNISNPRASWTAGHFLCAAIQDGPTMSSRLKRYIKLNSEAFTTKPLVYTNRNDRGVWTSLDIAAAYCGNKSMIQEIIQLDPLQLNHRNTYRLRPLGRYLECQMTRTNDWKDIAQCFLEADSSLSVVGNAIEGCLKTFTNKRIKNYSKLEDEVFEFISTLLIKFLKVAAFINEYGQSILHQLMSYHHVPSTLCIQLINLILHYSKGIIKKVDGEGYLPIHSLMEYHSEGFTNRLAIFNHLVSIYPESVTKITVNNDNVLHINTGDCAIVVAVCEKYPELLFKKNGHGRIPLHELMSYLSIFEDKPVLLNVIKVMCEVNREICELPTENDTDVSIWDNGYFALHYLVSYICDPDFGHEPMVLDVLKLLLLIYPAAVDIPADNGETPYLMLVSNKNVNPLFLRLLLRSHPTLDRQRLYQLNYNERRMALFLTRKAVCKDYLTKNIWKELWYANKEILKLVVSFL